MRSRLVVLILIVSLSLPVSTLTRPAESGQSSWAAISAVAKGKKHKSHKHKKHKQRQQPDQPQTTPDPIAGRQSVTQTFTSTQPMLIPAGAPGSDSGPANPYPTTINVNGFTNGVITDVNLTLHGLSHTAPVDLDVLLVPGQLPGQNAIVMSDAGNDPDVTDITLTLDDQAAEALPINGPLAGGTYRPTNIAGSSDGFPNQTPSGNTTLSVFNGGNPNGSWQLFVVDDHTGDTGQIAGGWSLKITAEVDVQDAQGQSIKQHERRR